LPRIGEFNTAEYLKNGKLRIGYIESIDFQPTSKAVKRVMGEVKAKLEAKGHEVIPFTLSPAVYREFYFVF